MDISKDYFFSKDAFQHYLQMNFDRHLTYDSFESKMLQKGIYGVLQPNGTPIEAGDRFQCRLDLRAMWPCARVFNDERCNWTWFESLVLDLLKIQEQVCAHMLAVDHIWWSWDYVFYDWQTAGAYIVYLPIGGKPWIEEATLQTLLMQLEDLQGFPLLRDPKFLRLMAYCKNPYFCAQGVEELLANPSNPSPNQPPLGAQVAAAPVQKAIHKKVESKQNTSVIKTKKWVILGLIQLIFCILYILCWIIIPLVTGDVGDAKLGSFLLLGGVDLYICLKLMPKTSPEIQSPKVIITRGKQGLKLPLARKSKTKVKPEQAVHPVVHPAVHPVVHPAVHPAVHSQVHPQMHSAATVSCDLPVEPRKIANHETVLLKPKSPKVYLIHQKTGEIYLLMQNKHLLGRNMDQVDCVLPSPTVGRQHAQIHRINHEDFLLDLDSKNGTLINGVPIKSKDPTSLVDGDVIQFGDYVMSYAKRTDADD